eukprot:TRINITY_DN28151_c0_g1_i2.p3 TRINITY_DN28151_c0_g1~~TRINITY_DN28151_c0_g1_i2.p3  ORF type:complete len:103 (+),score=5.27 TRINITY_DN28151_c0_g1_i2:326-634(+)
MQGHFLPEVAIASEDAVAMPPVETAEAVAVAVAIVGFLGTTTTGLFFVTTGSTTTTFFFEGLWSGQTTTTSFFAGLGSGFFRSPHFTSTSFVTPTSFKHLCQ